MRQTILLATLGLVSAAAHAGTPSLDLIATSPTTIAVGGAVDFQLSFNQYQENGSFDNSEGEPSPDIGFQQWISYFHESHTERLAGLSLQVAATDGPQASLVLNPSAEAGTDYSTSWNLSLRFNQAGSHQVLAWAAATQEKTHRRGDTVGTRECVGFDNSVQCTGWSFTDRLHDDHAWTEVVQASSLALQVQVVPEPATTVLWLAGAGLMLALRRRT